MARARSPMTSRRSRPRQPWRVPPVQSRISDGSFRRRPELLKRLRRVGRRRANADRVRREAAAELAELVKAAKASGVPVTQIARDPQLSRERIYKILEHDHP